jgi:soluble lytic murein transglycosylase-like protein
MASDLDGALAVLEPYLLSRSSKDERTAVRLLLGTIYMDQKHYNLASNMFYKVRQGEGGAAKVAAWYEALADLKRGRPHATIAECTAYREKYTGHRAEECRIVIGDAFAAQGKPGSAKAAYMNYAVDPEHKEKMRKEEMRLRSALAVMASSPKRSIPLLQALALQHYFAATGAGAASALAELRKAGHEGAVIPSDKYSRMKLAESLRASGWANEAWTHFLALEADGKNDPEIAKWAARSRPHFARRTRHFEPGAKLMEASYEKSPSGKKAWDIFDAWRNAGNWKAAAKWGKIGLEKHAKHYPWRSEKHTVAQAIMLSGDWKAASEAWGDALKSRHGSAQDARFYSALTAYLSGNTERAETGFSNVIQKGGVWRVPAHYWRSRVLEATGKDPTADQKAVTQLDKTGWYILLLDKSKPEGEGWVHRDGTWRGDIQPTLPELEGPDTYPGVQVGLWPSSTPVVTLNGNSRQGLDVPVSQANLGSIQWPFSVQPQTHEAPKASPVGALSIDLPESYAASAHHDPEAGLKALAILGNKYAEIWPDLQGAHQLAKAGLYNESGPIFREAWTEFRNPETIDDLERRAKIEALNISPTQWGSAARAARDHSTSTRYVWGQVSEIDSEALRKLRFPAAHARELWPHCQEMDVDPFLVLAIMRQESVYNPDAVSRTGAIGLMQFIKGTGAKMSALLDEPLFSPHGLFDPSVNLRYAVHYIHLLNERFDGNFPIAVASYNGGPHHMSRAHRDTLGELSLAAFVEMIIRAEPRHYVKKVTGFYQEYVDIYAPDGAKVILPQRLTHDDPEVINF